MRPYCSGERTTTGGGTGEPARQKPAGSANSVPPASRPYASFTSSRHALLPQEGPERVPRARLARPVVLLDAGRDARWVREQRVLEALEDRREHHVRRDGAARSARPRERDTCSGA